MDDKKGQKRKKREREEKTRRRRTSDTSLENEETSREWGRGGEQDDSVLGHASLSGKLLIP